MTPRVAPVGVVQPVKVPEAARRARADEVRHASRMAQRAQRWEGQIPCVHAAASSERSLLAAALENAAEGCVREAWGALSAHYPSATTRDPEAQRMWREIAVDESEHAELSFALHEWYLRQLTSEECAQVEAAPSVRACSFASSSPPPRRHTLRWCMAPEFQIPFAPSRCSINSRRRFWPRSCCAITPSGKTRLDARCSRYRCMRNRTSSTRSPCRWFAHNWPKAWCQTAHPTTCCNIACQCRASRRTRRLRPRSVPCSFRHRTKL